MAKQREFALTHRHVCACGIQNVGPLRIARPFHRKKGGKIMFATKRENVFIYMSHTYSALLSVRVDLRTGVLQIATPAKVDRIYE